MEVLILCITIFFARIIDVSLGTVRTIQMVKGRAPLAAGIAFVEIFIWFVMAREALNTDIVSIWIPIAFASGFATGTLIGSFVSNKFIKGVIGVQIITEKLNNDMIAKIREEGFAVSIMNLYSSEGIKEKNMLYLQVSNFNINKLKKLIKKLDPDAFMVVNETKYIQNGFIK